MSWNPQVTEGEQVLVSCTHVGFNGMPFGIMVTDRQLAYARPISLADEPVETVSLARSAVSDPKLTKRKPYASLVVGILLLSVLAFQAYAFVAGDAGSYSGQTFLIGLVGVTLIVSARNRYRLEWTADGKKHRIDQPSVFQKAAREKMATALTTAYALLNQR